MSAHTWPLHAIMMTRTLYCSAPCITMLVLIYYVGISAGFTGGDKKDDFVRRLHSLPGQFQPQGFNHLFCLNMCLTAYLKDHPRKTTIS